MTRNTILNNIGIIIFFISLCILDYLHLEIAREITLTIFGLYIIIFRKIIGHSMAETHLRIARRRKSQKGLIKLFEAIFDKYFEYVAILMGSFLILFGILGLLNII